MRVDTSPVMPKHIEEDTIADLKNSMAALRAELARAHRRVDQAVDVAKQAVNLARGTGDVTDAAARAVRKPTPPAAPKPEPVKTRVGDNGSTAELLAAVRALIAERPRTFVEILKETGARDGRVQGVLVRLQRYGIAVNMGTAGNRAVYWAPDPEVLKRIQSLPASRG